ncbi:IS1 transposase [Moraxella lincolnii]|uniref:IS1 transposase n=1 Tax=Lwoffella lincolnii TaxID=90241 RepID=A0A1T0CHJ0_9GAMM|nr:IS1 transposase [Moraxella lincolnii]
MHSYRIECSNHPPQANRTTKQVLGFVCGKRETKTFKNLYNNLNPNSIKLFCSDYWKSYAELMPKHKHLASKAQTFTIEGYNGLIRHFLARFRRRSKCHSKSEKMIENSLNLLSAKWNGSLSCVF